MSGRKGRSTHVEFRLEAEARSQGPASADGKTNPPSSSSNSRVGGTTNNTSVASTNSHASKRNASPLGEVGHSHVPTEYVVYALPDTDGVASISDELYAALAAVEEEKRRAAEESAAAAALNEAEHDAAKRGGRRGRSKSASGRRGSRRGSKRSGSISKGRRASRSKSRSRSRSSSVSSKGSSRARRSRSTSASSARSSTKRSRSSSRGSSGGKRASSKQGKRRTSPSKKKPSNNKNNKKMMAKPATRKKRSPSKSSKRGTSPNKNRRGRKTSRSSSRSSTRSKSSGKSSSRGSSASRRSNSTKAPTRTPSPSDRRKKAAAAPKKAATPSRMGGGGSRPSSQRGGARRASPKGRRGPSDGVTEKCLKSINYTSFAPSAKGGAKNKRQKMMSEFVAAYQRGIAIYDREYSAGMDDILKQYRVESVDPQARELLRLVKYITYLRDNCQQKLDLAQHLANTVLTGVEQLLQQAHESGLSLCEESNIISFQAPFVDGDANTAMGHPMPEVLGADEQLTENHPAQRFVPEQEVCKINGIRDFFNQSLEAIRCKEVVLPLPSAAPDVEDMVAACADEAAAEQTYVEERSQEADVVKVKLGDLSDAVANLLERVKHQDQEYRRKVEAQQRAMDEGATRQKVADDVLVGTRQQQCIIANDSIERLRQLSEELRTRMDQVELEVRSSVQEVIHNSAELCLDNKEYYDHVLQEERKMDCKRMCINKLERSVVEQAGLLREVQDEIMDLWRSHRAAHAGRSEKSTEVHRSLPTPYDAMLRQCDRDTLLRLLHHISLMNDGATGRLMGALDEHAHFLAGNSAEAVAVKERTAKIEAVAALLDKVQEEGGIHRNPHAITKSLSETVMHMVEQYSRLMSFDEKHTRAVIRREEARQRVDPPAFFSDLTPVPPRMANKAADHQPMRCPYSELLYPPIDPEEGRRASARATNSQQHGHSSMSTAMAMSKEVMHHALPPLKHTQAPPPEVVSALRRSNPSTQHTTCSTISVVGDGRWGGMAAVPRRDGVSTREMFADNTPSFITQPTLPRRTGRQRTALTEAMEAEAQRKAAQPSPSLPERLGLVNHVLGTYNHSFEELADGTVCVEAPDKIKKAYMDDDMKYIDQQRALHQRMFDDSHLDVDLD